MPFSIKLHVIIQFLLALKMRIYGGECSLGELVKQNQSRLQFLIFRSFASAHGHSSDSTLTSGCVVTGAEPLASPLPGSAYGHSSDSTLGVGCVVPGGSEPQRAPLPGSAHGHSSDSTLGMGCVVKGPKPGGSSHDEAGTPLEDKQSNAGELVILNKETCHTFSCHARTCSKCASCDYYMI